MSPRDRARSSEPAPPRVGPHGARTRPRRAPRPTDPADGDAGRGAGPGAAAGEDAPPSPAPRLDGRRTHVVDRAADYLALADGGLTVARIARRRRRSKGYVSILLRFGRLLATLPPAERDAMRSPRITWSLAQRLMRLDIDAASARAQLRYALGGFSTASLGPSAAPPRGTSTGPAAGVDGGSDARPGERPTAGPRRGARRTAVAWGWDADWFARDPAGYVAAHLEHFTHLHRVVATRARAAVLTPADVGQGLRALGRLLASQRGAATAPRTADPTTARAVAALEVIGRKLAEAAGAIAALPEVAGPTGTVPAAPESPALTPVEPDELLAAVDADLAD
jgi:hypothetical protein